MNTLSPATVWGEMVAGNQRFIDGTPLHPRQDVERRAELAQSQTPRAALFGCSDSRLSAEIIFDLGLGDLFVVRNAGQVISSSVLGSLEYAVEAFDIPLILVLAHDNCGAVGAAIRKDADPSTLFPPHVDAIVADILPAVVRTRDAAGAVQGAEVDGAQVGLEHLRDTISGLLAQSELIGQRIADGKLAIVGANYRLSEGRVISDVVVGDIS
jgi:carbonic anhydrase